MTTHCVIGNIENAFEQAKKPRLPQKLHCNFSALEGVGWGVWQDLTASYTLKLQCRSPPLASSPHRATAPGGPSLALGEIAFALQF